VRLVAFTNPTFPTSAPHIASSVFPPTTDMELQHCRFRRVFSQRQAVILSDYISSSQRPALTPIANRWGTSLMNEAEGLHLYRGAYPDGARHHSIAPAVNMYLEDDVLKFGAGDDSGPVHTIGMVNTAFEEMQLPLKISNQGKQFGEVGGQAVLQAARVLPWSDQIFTCSLLEQLGWTTAWRRP
jgi:hypothetical protein